MFYYYLEFNSKSKLKILELKDNGRDKKSPLTSIAHDGYISIELDIIEEDKKKCAHFSQRRDLYLMELFQKLP